MKKICVIGAGASGIPAIKCCLDEGITPVCLEQSHDIGGLWRYEKSEKEGASVYKSIIINTSKEMMCYSDFPIPKHFPNFMHNSKVMEYMRLYVKNFNLLPHIRFNTEVLQCQQNEDYDDTGRWKVTSKNRTNNEVNTEIFDGVIVCIGHHSTPYNPCHTFPGFESFKGLSLHSHSYKTPFKFVDKKVLVIGIGNSGGDIAVELGQVASQVHLSTRRGAWVLSRVGPSGIPIDFTFTTKLARVVQDVVPSNLVNWFMESNLNRKFDHAKYGIKPEHRVFSQHPTVNDSLPNSILSGRVVVKGNVQRFTEDGVVFEDGSLADVDVVIFATGYSFGFPFIDDSIIKVENNNCRLYRHMWPPNQKHGSLVVIGNIQPLGAINPISEIQCRWATRVMKGDLKLPPSEVMEQSINETKSAMKRKFYSTPRHTIQVDYVQYMDDIADMIGVRVDLARLFMKDPKLALKVLFGPVTPYQYRLFGHGSCSNARHLIMTQEERMLCPLKTRKVAEDKSSGWFLILMVLLMALILFWIL